jgi:hypothetical protein
MIIRAPVLASLVFFVSVAGATKPSLPEAGRLDLKLDDRNGIVLFEADAHLRNVVVEIYGLDGLRVGQDDLVWLRFASVKAGQRIEIPFSLERGQGRSALVVFVRSPGRLSQLTRQLGELSAEQLRRNNACARRDPEGTWIKLMGCEEEGPAPIVPRPNPILNAVETASPGGVLTTSQLRIDGDRVELTPVQTVWANPTCQAITTLAGRLKSAGHTQRADWAAFQDAGCTVPIRLSVSIERGQ